jgi:hypothetical protein
MDFSKNKGGPAEAGPETVGHGAMDTELGEAETSAATELWRRWQTLAPEAEPDEPDFMALAAFAEGRATETASDAVDAWLLARPERLDDIVAARSAATPEMSPEMSDDAATERMMARAMALVAAPAAGVVAFRRPTTRVAGWRSAVAWGGLAASVAATSLVGFALGSNAWSTYAGDQQASGYQEIFDPPTGIFSGTGDDEGI